MLKSVPAIPELLAPSGSADALRAAVSCGADAVYLGVDKFNARQSAENFTVETLSDACDYAHLRGVRVYLTVNVVILPSETQEALELVDAAWAAGVDAVILQDLGLIRIVREVLPQVRVHASTQLNAHSSATIAALASRGVARVTLARETSLPEIGSLVLAGERAGVEVESFVHGAICVCYSGQCLLSSLIGGRSANRGHCAQPCRLPYELIDEAGRVLGDAGAHLLSPKDLAGITVLPEFIDAGVAALKIEGRMKSAEYVSLVTGVYRDAIDRAAHSDGEYSVREGELSVLKEAFSRGFTEAYLTGERGNEMMSYKRPNNRGVPVGRVTQYKEGKATIALDVPLEAEDTIELWTSRGRFAQRVGVLSHGEGTHRSAPSGVRVTIAVDEAVSQGDRVFRVRNAALSAAATRTFETGSAATVPLRVEVRLVVGEPLRIRIIDEIGRSGQAEGAVVEEARTKAVTAEEVEEHVGRMGGTAFSAHTWDVSLSPNAGIGYSTLHRIRREAIEAYERDVLSPWAGRSSVAGDLPYLSAPYRHKEPAPRLVAAVSDLPTARACLQAGCNSVFVPVWALGDDPLPRGVVPSLPRVCHDAELDMVLGRITDGESIIAGTLGVLETAKNLGIRAEAHWSLNAVNPYSVAELADMGAAFVWLSPELSSRQIAEVASRSVVPVGIAISGRQEVMVTEHCVLMSEGPCSQRCATCKRRSGWRFLRDRKGYSFPVSTDPTGRTHIFNSVPLDLTSALPEVLSTGVAALRLDLETEPANRAAAHVARVRQALQDVIAGRDVEKFDRSKVTAGHFFRGVK